MRLTIPETVNKSTHVYRLGYLYPIELFGKERFSKAVSTLAANPMFGEPARQYHFNSSSSTTVSVSKFHEKYKPLERVWYADTRFWASRHKRIERHSFHLVFKDERSRTLALTMLS